MIILAIIRLILMILSLTIFISIVLLRSLILGENIHFGLKSRRVLMRFVSWFLGLKINKSGKIPIGTYIYISNHRSWIDGLVLLSDLLVLPVGKMEVSRWPLIGYAAKISGVLFVKRESKDSRAATLDAVKKYIEKGFSILIFPEGTTHTDLKTMPFKKGGFGLAAEENFSIAPIALDYENKNDAWINDDTFIPHFLRTFKKWKTQTYINYGEPIHSNDTEILVQKTKEWIDQKLLIINNLKQNNT